MGFDVCRDVLTTRVPPLSVTSASISESAPRVKVPPVMTTGSVLNKLRATCPPERTVTIGLTVGLLIRTSSAAVGTRDTPLLSRQLLASSQNPLTDEFQKMVGLIVKASLTGGPLGTRSVSTNCSVIPPT